jgi:uncharacterized protein (DUF488 family)
MNTLYTIGYSSFTEVNFLHIIRQYHISAVADVRSQPFSKFKPEFNGEIIKSFLRENGIYYVFLGNECGARISAPECYINGKADYGLISNHPIFHSGLKRIVNGLSKHNIVLMCAEKDPIMCHRTILICKNLKNDIKNIEHILHNGDVETQSHIETRLLSIFHLDGPDLFRTHLQLVEEAYRKQGDSIAYIDESTLNREEAIDGNDIIYNRVC